MKINKSSVKSTIKATACEYRLNNSYLIMNIVTIAKMKSKQNVIIQYKVFIVIYCLYICPLVMIKTLSSAIITTNIHEKP